MDDLHYLEPGFDPATLTVPNLRNILVTHDIDYPSSAKKSQLVDLFNAHVKPLAKKLLAARAKVRRSASGIQNVYSGVEAPSDEEGDDAGDREMTPVAPQRTRRQSSRVSSRYSSRAATEESEAPSIAPSVGSRRSTRHSSLIPSEASEVESETPRQSNARRSRKSVNTPAVVKEESPAADEESPFTNDNIFQQGSSPFQEMEQSRRRTTLGSTTSEKKRSSTGRRKTDMTPTARASNARTSTFKVPIASPESDEDELEAGEEFEPEEELALAAEAEQNGGLDVLPARKRKAKGSAGTAFKGLLAILTVMSGAVFYKWREEKLAVGFCGVGRPSSSIGGVEIPDWAPEWAEAILPTCEPCPAHAYCGKDLEATCESDFIVTPHPLSLWGTVPLPPTCEPDSEKARRVQAVADRAVEVLRERNARFECGELRDEAGKKLEAPIPEPELKATVSVTRRRSLSQEDFDDLWASALGELANRDEISSGVDGSGHATLRSNSLARISFGCAIRRSVRATVAEYLRYIVMFGLVVGAVAYVRSHFRAKRTLEAKGKQLAGFALDRLATQAALHADGRAQEPFIAVNQLRDDVLRDEFSRKSREAVWGRVRDKVEGNANVRSSMKETRTGDMARVWEWIGALDVLDDNDSENSPWGSSGQSRRRSGRYSLGPGVSRGIEDGSSLAQNDDSGRRISGSPRKGEAVEQRRRVWDEGRPIY